MATHITSFWYAIYKRLWATGRSYNAHNSDAQAYGGFKLYASSDQNGVFGHIGNQSSMKPLPAGNFTAAALAAALAVLLAVLLATSCRTASLTARPAARSSICHQA